MTDGLKTVGRMTKGQMAGSDQDAERITRRIRFILGAFVVALILSGVTAFPLVHELAWVNSWLGEGTAWGARLPELARWLSLVERGVRETSAQYPFILYGTDWLAFAHLMIGVAFWGPWKDPVRNAWVIDFGLIACACIFPLAFICGPIRDIPIYWTLIDCSFGVFGALPLLMIRRDIRRLERLGNLNATRAAV